MRREEDIYLGLEGSFFICKRIFVFMVRRVSDYTCIYVFFNFCFLEVEGEGMLGLFFFLCIYRERRSKGLVRGGV